MSKIIPISDYQMSDSEHYDEGIILLDEALSHFDEMKSFEGKNIAALVYVALKYGEDNWEN